MGLPNEVSSALIGAAAAGGYEIEQSLRFVASSSTRLTRTPSSSGNMRTWTLSMWVKKWEDIHSDGKYLWAAGVWSSGNTNTGQYWTGPDRLASVNGVNGVNNNGGATTPGKLYRDPSAWYHLVIRMDTANATTSNRHRIYVNGELLASASSVTQNFEGAWNRNVNHAIGGNNNHGTYSDVYIAEVHNVDGQSLDPTSFGEYDDNGVWRPIPYSGSYGTNGFYLKFDPSATNGIGHDHSGNGNNFTPTNFTTSGTGTDVMRDTPTNNFAILNTADHSTDAVPLGFTEGALQVQHRSGSGSYSLAVSTLAFDSDDSDGFYFESIATDYVSSSYQSVCLVDADKTVQDFIGNAPVGSSTGSEFGIGWESSSGYLRNFGSGTTGWGPTTTTWTSDGDILMVFVKNNKVYLGKNGTWLQSADPSTESNPAITLSSAYKLKPGTAGRYSAKQSFNFGQRDFSYTPPSGAKTLCTANLPTPDIADGSQHFNTVTYTGDGQSTHAITGVGFQPNLSWIKNRSRSNHHVLQDSVRGITQGDGNQLTPNKNFTEDYNGNGHIGSYDSDGFTLEDGTSGPYPRQGTNYNNDNYVAWLWKAGTASGSSNTSGSTTSTVSANATAGFSIVTYTGTGSAATVGHGLGVAPNLIFVKRRNNTGNWTIYADTSGPTKYFLLNGTNAATSVSSVFWNSTAPTSTVFSLGTNGDLNGNGDTYVAYCFANVEGYSKFGSYTGNGSTNGPFVHTGFAVRWLMWKKSSSTSNWVIWDTERHPFNVADSVLFANNTDTEETNAAYNYDLLSNGFKVRTGSGTINDNGATYIYLAFAENPFGGDGVSPATAR